MRFWFQQRRGEEAVLEHTASLIGLCATRYAEERLLTYPHYKSDQLQHITGAELAEKSLDAAKALVGVGVKEGEPVGIYSPNRQGCLYCELGLFAIRAVSVPFYATASPDQVYQIALEANIKVMFVGEQYQYNNAYQVQSERGQLERIIIFDHRVVKQFNDKTSIYYDDFVRMGDAMSNETLVRQRRCECLPSDLALLIYTSGTTGKPKGVMVDHLAITTQLNKHRSLLPSVGRGDVSANFLPMSHIFEKMWVYFCLFVGARVAIVSDPHRVPQLLPLFKPTMMCNVPRYWEKVYKAVEAEVAGRSRFSQRLFSYAVEVGKRYRLGYRNEGRRPPLLLHAMYKLLARLVFRQIKHRLGLQRGRLFPTAGAYLSDSINAFLQACGFPIIIGYGLSESCATVSLYPREGYKIGSVGDIVDHVEVRIDPETSEIQLRGDTISKGYYKDTLSTEQAFTADGWFRTGDAGHLEGRTLYFRERLKDLFKTANGKYIAPQQIETLLVADPLIEQVACIADDRRFVSALVYPHWERLQDEAKKRGLLERDLSLEQLCHNEAITNVVMARIEQLQGGLATYEKVKRIVLISEPFSLENGLLTHTLKLRRKAIEQAYAQALDEVYFEA